jgi:hypothetical protein
MNKLKLLYDVFKTMRNKDVLQGTVSAQVQKNQTQIFSIKNDFEKNLATGQLKAKIATELDCDGTRMKHESRTEFSLGHNHEPHHSHEFARHMHHHFPWECGIKHKFSKLAVLFGLLNTLSCEEQANQTFVISVNLKQLPEDLRFLLQEKLSKPCPCPRHGRFLQELRCDELLDFTFHMHLTADTEIEKLSVTARGLQTDEEGGQHQLSAKADVSFIW